MSEASATASLVYGHNSYSSASLKLAIENMKADCRTAGLTTSSVAVLHVGLTDRYVVALLALAEMGCCVVPVDPATHPAVVNDLAATTAAVAIVSDSEITVCDNKRSPPQLPTLLAENIDDAAYVLFTSGTSGEPKGVVGTRRGLANRIEWGCRHFFSADVRRCAIKTNPAFIDSLTEIMTAYRSGRTMIIAPLPAQRDLRVLCEFIDEAAIEQITLTPSCIPVLDEIGGDKLRSVRRWIFSGEELRRSWLSRIRALSPGAELINSYGSTEVCGDATFQVYPAHSRIPDTVTIGKAVPGVDIAVDSSIDLGTGDADSLLPLGAGELRIGGQQVAHGYLHSTRSRESDPFCRAPDGTRWFRTGDIVHESDGLLYFLGRIDHMQKVRGRRVDPSGVAAALESLEGVHLAHAWVSQSKDRPSTVRAAVTPAPGATLTPASVITAMQARVLPHLVPDRVDIVTEFLRTPSGKIDIRRTIGGHVGRPLPQSRFPTGMQHVIACIVSEAVEDSDIWPTTLLSQLGLDSLQADRVAAELSRYFGCRVTALDVLSAETVEQLAQQIPALQAQTNRSATRLVRSGLAQRTLLLLHPAIGTCLGYFQLLQHISYHGQIVFVEQNERARTILNRHGMEALAVYYAGEVAAHHPHAAIDVAGYSFGALIAPTVAGALRGLNRSVSSVTLIDPASIEPGAQVTLDWALRRILTDAGYQDQLTARPLNLDSALRLIRGVSGPLAQTPRAQLGHWSECLRSNVNHCAGYQPTEPSSPTLVVRAQKTSSIFTDTTTWLERTEGIATVVNIQCTHFELLHGDSVIELASSMSEFLKDRTRDEY